MTRRSGRLGWTPAVVLAASLTLAAQELTPQMRSEIARTVPEGIGRELTACKVQNAMWGGYDVDVHVTMGIDGLPYLFTLQRGRFSRIVDPAPLPGPIRFERTGRIGASSAEEAFAKGLPFYISRAELMAPDRLSVSVLSNPAASIELATLFVAIDQPGVDDLATVTLPLQSAGTPQRLLAINPALGKPVVVRAAILRDVGTTALTLGCVLSNEVEVRQVL